MWFWLSDGQVVDAQEVERIYAEQQRRMLGIDEFAPAASVRSENRLKDGYVPLASQIERGRREEDPTCHPNGGWEHDPGFHKYSKRTRDYEAQVTRAPGLDYVVRNPDERAVKFDGCAVWDPSHPLLEAKGPGYDAVIDAGERYGFIKSIAKKPESQGQRQVGAARGRPIEWHAAERRALEFFERAMPPAASAGVRFVHTPPR